MPVDLRQIPLTRLKPTELNQRRIRPDDPKLVELAESIKNNSQVIPCLARPHPGQKGVFELLSGSCVWWGCQIAGIETMDVLVVNLDDEAAKAAILQENLQFMEQTKPLKSI